MPRRNKKRNCDKPFLKRNLLMRVFPFSFFFSLVLIFFTNFKGTDVHDAFQHSFNLFINLETAPYIWSLVIITHLMIYYYLLPIRKFHIKFYKGKSVREDFRNQAMRRFNSMMPFILLIVPAAFFAGSFLDPQDWGLLWDSSRLSILYKIMEALSTGLLLAIMLIMKIENAFFKTKRALLSQPISVRPSYSSFYFKLFISICAIVAFLVFQVFDNFSLFFMQGTKELSKEMLNRDMTEGAVFLKVGMEHSGLKSLINIFTIKIVVYFIFIIYLLGQIKNMIKNPLNTVQEKLEELNSANPEASQEISIVNNDEFAEMYYEINKLIEKQRRVIRDSRERLENIVENAADPIITFDSEGKIHVSNPAAESFFGYEGKELHETSFMSLIDLPGMDSTRDVFTTLLKNPANNLKRLTAITKTGEKKNVEANISKAGRAAGLIYTAILRDISKQLSVEHNLKEAKISAEKANKMKSEFLANMSHELRTPLNAVLGFTQILTADKNLTDSQLDKIDIISRSGEHLLALINDILDISKIEAGKIEMHISTFDLIRFVEDIKEMFSLRCEKKGLAFYVEYIGELPQYVDGDLGKLRQILINIIGNAVKFTFEGGISLRVGIFNDKIRFSVNDTGKGIPENEIDKILQPFVQSTNINHEGGTGLGLAITNRFIEMMGGKLEIESEEGKGSTFSFEILLEESMTPPESVSEIGEVLRIKGENPVKVLIVDDKINNRLILKTMLERVGFITQEAENGKTAVEQAEEFDPAIIFMDIKMPVMDGYESVSRIKEKEFGQKMKVFALTASAFKHDEERIFSSGFDGFLAKPFKQNSLFQLIQDTTDVEFEFEENNGREEIELPDRESLDYKEIAGNLSKEQLETLDEYILINDFTAVKDWLNEVENNKILSPFLMLIRHYANSFDERGLEFLINKINEETE